MTRLFIVGAKRTPFGAFGGKLKNFSATELSYLATKAALSSSNTPASAVDTVCVGNVQQTSPDAAYLARHAALRPGPAHDVRLRRGHPIHLSHAPTYSHMAPMYGCARTHAHTHAHTYRHHTGEIKKVILM